MFFSQSERFPRYWQAGFNGVGDDVADLDAVQMDLEASAVSVGQFKHELLISVKLGFADQVQRLIVRHNYERLIIVDFVECFFHGNDSSEGDGNRTRNHRIDSPVL
jgi:hypothetical protein